MVKFKILRFVICTIIKIFFVLEIFDVQNLFKILLKSAYQDEGVRSQVCEQRVGFILKEMSKRDFDRHEIDILHCVDGDGRNSLRLSVNDKILVTKGFEAPPLETKHVISAKPILFLLQIANQTGFTTDYP